MKKKSKKKKDGTSEGQNVVSSTLKFFGLGSK